MTHPIHDPLNILASTARIMSSSQDVHLDVDAIERHADAFITTGQTLTWDADLHFRDTGPDGDERTAMWILVLDALNFCFWGQGTDPSVRWRVERHGELHDGYMALVAALQNAVDTDIPIFDATWLAHVETDDVRLLLAPAPGHPDIPLVSARVAHLRELGQGLLTLQNTSPALTLLQQADGSAIALIQDVVTRFPSFNDVAISDHHEVRFYKRAQILAADLAGALADSPAGHLRDLHHLTAFADYKVPQVLQGLGILRYSPALTHTLAARTSIPMGSRPEIEIRAATIQACEALRSAIASRGHALTAAEIDWYLWTTGQSLPADTLPYHRTVTPYY